MSMPACTNQSAFMYSTGTTPKFFSTKPASVVTMAPVDMHRSKALEQSGYRCTPSASTTSSHFVVAKLSSTVHSVAEAHNFRLIPHVGSWSEQRIGSTRLTWAPYAAMSACRYARVPSSPRTATLRSGSADIHQRPSRLIIKPKGTSSPSSNTITRPM